MNQNSHLALPSGTSAEFEAAQFTNAPRRGHRQGQLRFNETDGKLQIYNDGRWTSG